MQRQASISRKTAETDIQLKLVLDGEGKSSVSTGIPFMDHMLTLFAKHGSFDLTVCAKGDLEVDAHHTMEDLGLVFGDAIAEALGDKKSIRRYGSFILPMDETLSLVALDLSGRPYLVYRLTEPQSMVGTLPTALFREFFTALVNRSGMNLHIRMLETGEIHHVFESVFKGFARALAEAVSIDPNMKGIPSTKGIL